MGVDHGRSEEKRRGQGEQTRIEYAREHGGIPCYFGRSLAPPIDSTGLAVALHAVFFSRGGEL